MEVCFGVTPMETFPLFTPIDEDFEEMLEIFRQMRITEEKQMEVREDCFKEVKSILLNRKVCNKVTASARKRLRDFSQLPKNKKLCKKCKKDSANDKFQDPQNKMTNFAPKKKVLPKLKM